MPNDAYSQQSLADDQTFRRRIKDALNLVAWQVIEEPADTPYHQQRVQYARTSVLANLEMAAQQVAPWIVSRTNLIAADTSYNFAARATVSAATDADIQSQLMSDWNVMAGVV
jgi:hypothetical protein